ncbi:GNAT family N-acetyltransferase [Ruminococcus sp. OM05-10BH]|nr:GNAT family N-acetyltransferase [Ruminococcus sp. OM05-10BH]
MEFSKLKGKKLLILGATSGETTLVKRAQEYGIYTIVTDNHLDYSLSPAKLLANEVWDISWSDIDALEMKCKERGIDGVTAGYSEIRVDCLIKLCKRLALPCYITEEQLDITRDKLKFKSECRKNGVPVVKEYDSIDEVDEYPVIVKPVDRAGSIGISIANNRDELKKAYQYAEDLSICKKVIIEKYMQDRKIDVYYSIENGEIDILSTCDTIFAENNNNERVVQSCWLYPMKQEKEFLEKADANLRKMIKGMGIQYGCIFFSGFVTPLNEFVFFECGFRLEGAHQYNYVFRKGKFNFLDLFIFHALLGNTQNMPRNKKIDNNLKCAVINVYANEGVISEISGDKVISEMKDCCLTLISGRKGQECKADQAILSKVGMFSFCNQSDIILANDIRRAYHVLKVQDDKGNDLIYDRINPDEIINWWECSSDMIKIIPKPSEVSYEDIQKLLARAHKSNIDKGLCYATAFQSVDRLKQKIKDGICFTAVLNDEKSTVIGTATICFIELNYWYYKGRVGLIKLIGIDTDYKGGHISTRLVDKCLQYAMKEGVQVVVTDSADKNVIVYNLFKKFGFERVDYCKYQNNNFISAVYALFFQGHEWTEEECQQRCEEKYKMLLMNKD